MNNRLDATPAVRRRMQRTGGRDNPFERSVRSLLHASGVRYRIHYPLPVLKRCNCDLALPRLKVAIFLDGCFWHGCPIHPAVVKKNTEFWVQKIARNRERDAQVTDCLTAGGWTVLRYWEHEKPEAIAQSIISVVNAAAA
ncbi:very short patch repair endonuclease [Mesorhizobium sp. B3-1-3]|uniref:very short patch repair endonuclease n=1 Tax=unclassified Mesorhizobium TaxID=325217 RepID=UPI00112B841C|nr:MULTISPECIES: very short patch repair endonuclease [unclassified Mesorhizobium]TPI70020.1 very short patch repair endonuclease [Mesorhizobium sp. B3-1-8]TPI75155.1 very short patch repair endonuclease [Mesorhizobium sp. B3-1-3]